MTGPGSAGATGRERLTRALAADLRDLAVDLEAGSYTRATLGMLRRDLAQVVPSSLGASVRVELDRVPGVPVQIDLASRTLQPDEIASGLRLPLDLLSQALTGSVLLYASEPAAFHELGADLARLLQVGAGRLDHDPELPREPVVPSVSGLEDLSLVNRALGVLMNRGHSLVAARTELESRAQQVEGGLIHAARALIVSVGR